MSYYDSGAANTPRYRIWSGSSWGDENTASDVGAAAGKFHVLRSNPKKNEKILGTIDAAADTNVQVWNGTSWSTAIQLTGESTTGNRSFDIAYEQNSGEAIVVYRKSTAISVPKCQKWDGSSWTVIGDLTDRGHYLKWIRLEPKPGSNEIMLVTLDDDEDINAQIWDGDNDTWGTYYSLELAAETSAQQCFDIAYEQSSKDCMIVFADTALDTPEYSIWNGSSWSGGFALDQGSADMCWVKLAAKPGSDEIILATGDAGEDVDVQVWNGSSPWDNYVHAETGTPTSADRSFDIAYEQSSGEGLLVWSDSTATPKYLSWYGSWGSTEGSANPMADDAVIYWVKLGANPDTNDIMLLTSDANDDINVQKWGGSSWGGIEEKEAVSYSRSECFAIDYDGHSSRVSIIMRRWRELYH